MNGSTDKALSWKSAWGLQYDVPWLSSLYSSQNPYYLVMLGSIDVHIGSYQSTHNDAIPLQRPALDFQKSDILTWLRCSI